MRIRRICKKDEDFNSHSENMIAHYIRRGYPKRILKKHLAEIQKYSQDDLLLPKIKSDEKSNRMVLVLDYNPANPDIIGILKNNWKSLEASPNLGELFKEIPMVAHKRAKNLKDTLVKASITYPPEPTTSMRYNNRPKPCKRVRCPLCPLHINQQTIYSPIAKATYKLPRVLDCETRNLIYCIQCKTCGKLYVGETLRSLRERINEHLGDIRQHRIKKPVARHFLSKGHSIKSFSHKVLELIKRDPKEETCTKYRRARERDWIFKLRCLEPIGLNSMTLAIYGKPY
jgi:hypothetical protein